MTEIEKVDQSQKGIPIDDALEIHTSTISYPAGGGYRQRGTRIFNPNHAVHTKRAIVEISNDTDQLCFARSIAVGLAKHYSLLSKSYIRHQFEQGCKVLVDYLHQNSYAHICDGRIQIQGKTAWK